MATAVTMRRLRIRSEITTGVGWDAAGGPDPSGINLADNGRDFPSSQHPLTGLTVQCVGQVLLRIRVQGGRKRFRLPMRQTLSGTIHSAKKVHLDGLVPAGQAEFSCSIPYSYVIAVPSSQYPNFVVPAQPTIDIVDRIDNTTQVSVVEAEDVGQVLVTYKSLVP